MRPLLVHLSISGALLLAIVSPAVAVAGGAPGLATTRPVASTPGGAVLTIIRPFFDQRAQSAACNAEVGRITACPISPRLRAALSREIAWERAHVRGGTLNPFCRCQNTPRSVFISGVKAPYWNASGTFAEVDTVWHWGSGPVNISWMTRRVPGGWQVENNFCSGYPSTDLYHIPTSTCPTM